MALLFVDTENPIQEAIDHYRGVSAYEMTLKSLSAGKSEIIHYYFKKPNHVRMEFISPFNGAVLIYDPGTKQAKLWPFGHGSFPSFSLSPGNSLIRSSTGQRVDRSDVGVLYQNVKTLQDHGKIRLAGAHMISGREALQVVVMGANGYTVGAVSRYQLWLDRATGFPLKVMSFDIDHKMIEMVEMNDWHVSPDFPADFFKQ